VTFAVKALPHLPPELEPALAPVLEVIATLDEQIRTYDRRIEELATERYPETVLLRQVAGVGALTALTYVLTLEDPARFPDLERWAPISACVPARPIPGISLLSCTSPKPATRCSGVSL
jgi:transposase